MARVFANEEAMLAELRGMVAHEEDGWSLEVLRQRIDEATDAAVVQGDDGGGFQEIEEDADLRDLVGEATWIASGAAEGEDGSRQWRLVAWRISGDTSQIEAFHERRSSSWARLTLEAPPTIRSGESGCVGASAGAFRHGGPTR
jgi:hypothetical protein